MSDPVLVTLITTISSTVTTIATLVLRRSQKKTQETVKQQHAETRQSLAESCRHPFADMPARDTHARTRRND